MYNFLLVPSKVTFSMVYLQNVSVSPTVKLRRHIILTFIYFSK